MNSRTLRCLPLPRPPPLPGKEKIITSVTPVHWMVIYPEALPSVMDTNAPCKPNMYRRFDNLYKKPEW